MISWNSAVTTQTKLIKWIKTQTAPFPETQNKVPTSPPREKALCRVETVTSLCDNQKQCRAKVRREGETAGERERERERGSSHRCVDARGVFGSDLSPDYHVFKDAASDVCELYWGRDKPAAVVRACWCSQWKRRGVSRVVDCASGQRDSRTARTKSRCTNQQLLLAGSKEQQAALPGPGVWRTADSWGRLGPSGLSPPALLLYGCMLGCSSRERRN